MEKNICGIQQIGIGYCNIKESWKWYRKYFGMDVPVFEDTAEASLMYKYTGNAVYKRHAILAMNMQGGAGFELWQFADRKPKDIAQAIKVGDLGIGVIKIKSKDVHQAYNYFLNEGLKVLSNPERDLQGNLHFYLEDPFANLFEIIESNNWFTQDKNNTGGVAGLVLGVSNMERSLQLYKDVLGYETVVYDETKVFDDLQKLNGGDCICRRVLLKHSKSRTGGFSRLLGDTEIELIQRTDNKGVKIYHNRFWGDNGFIHVCFDVIGMKALKNECEKAGFPFTVDSANSFDMGKAAGHFSYIEDPDGTLIEFVETHKVPVFKKLGLYLNLKNRNPNKNLPDWMVKMLSFARIKD